jgi:hypothetical protein
MPSSARVQQAFSLSDITHSTVNHAGPLGRAYFNRAILQQLQCTAQIYPYNCNALRALYACVGLGCCRQTAAQMPKQICLET